MYSIGDTFASKCINHFDWILGLLWPIRFYFTTFPNGYTGQSGLTLQLFQ